MTVKKDDRQKRSHKYSPCSKSRWLPRIPSAVVNPARISIYGLLALLRVYIRSATTCKPLDQMEPNCEYRYFPVPQGQFPKASPRPFVDRCSCCHSHYWRAFAAPPPGFTAVASTETPPSPGATRTP